MRTHALKRPVVAPPPARVEQPALQAKCTCPENLPAPLLNTSAPSPAPPGGTGSTLFEMIKPRILAEANAALAAAGRRANDCPYLAYWMRFYAGKDDAQVERAIRAYTGSKATTNEDLADVVATRVRRAVDSWVATGKVTGVPPQTDIQKAVSGDGTQQDQAGSNAMGAPAAEATPQMLAKPGGGGATVDPQAVRSSLGAGSALDAGVRARMESAFGQSFGDVRIHTGSTAEGWNSKLSARAFTVGADIAFGRGEYHPGTMAGSLLIAHELAHVVQQRGGGVSREQSRDKGLEREADHAAASAMGLLSDEQEKYPKPGRGLRLQRCDRSDKKEDAGAVKDAGPVAVPDAGTVDAGPVEEKPGGNMAHKPLSKADTAAILAVKGMAAFTGPAPSFSSAGARFVLHDTGTSFGTPTQEASHLARNAAEGSTPVGEGPAAFVNAAGAVTQTHPRFYNQTRPTATEFEKGNDLMDQFTRETTMQAIWGATSPTAQGKAISDYLTAFPGLSAKDLKDERAKATDNLDPTKTTPHKIDARHPAPPPVVMTTATGAVGKVCDVVAASGAAGVANTGMEKALGDACAKMKPVFDARKQRIPDTTNLEIIKEAGSDCSTSTRKGATTPLPPYDPAVYDGVAFVYLKAALEAGQFPEITTHYFLDATATASQNRCDPRCFNLDLLYSKIAALLGHPVGTTYGVTPTYGTTWGTSTVWWHPPVCGAVPGSAPPAPPPPAKKKP